MGDIVGDLMTKVSDDVTRCIVRTLAIAPEPQLPIGISAIAATLGATACILQRLAGGENKEPESENIMLAALLGARMSIEPDDAVSMAYEDLECLRTAGRIKPR